MPALRLHTMAGLVTLSLLAGCAAPRGNAPDAPASTNVRTTGTVIAVDTAPWAYDGNAIVRVDTPDGRVAVELPARWNLCRARPVSVDTLEAGTRVEVVGARMAGGEIVVCADASHRLAPLPPAD